VASALAITLAGYGCENGVGQPSGPSRLKLGDTHCFQATAGTNSWAYFSTF